LFIRDFAAAKMIGSSGLLGRSWPDLDMLPLGYLTDPGNNNGLVLLCDKLEGLLLHLALKGIDWTNKWV